jgi:hypothetical protein
VTRPLKASLPSMARTRGPGSGQDVCEWLAVGGTLRALDLYIRDGRRGRSSSGPGAAGWTATRLTAPPCGSLRQIAAVMKECRRALWSDPLGERGVAFAAWIDSVLASDDDFVAVTDRSQYVGLISRAAVTKATSRACEQMAAR